MRGQSEYSMGTQDHPITRDRNSDSDPAQAVVPRALALDPDGRAGGRDRRPGAVTIWLAVSSSDGLVADDYYKRGLAINQELRRDQAALDLGIAAAIEARDGVLRVRLDGPRRGAARRSSRSSCTRRARDTISGCACRASRRASTRPSCRRCPPGAGGSCSRIRAASGGS